MHSNECSIPYLVHLHSYDYRWLEIEMFLNDHPSLPDERLCVPPICTQHDKP